MTTLPHDDPHRKFSAMLARNAFLREMHQRRTCKHLPGMFGYHTRAAERALDDWRYWK